MAKEIQPAGPVIHAPPTLHGKRVKLIREGKEVDGFLTSKDGKDSNENLIFQWTNKNGIVSIGELTGEELEVLLSG